MATNFVQEGRVLTVTFAAAKLSGAYAVQGENVRGVVLKNTVEETSGNHVAPVDTEGVYNLSVVAKTAQGANSAVAFGDKLYYKTATGEINKDDAGLYVGTYVGATITAGATATGPVKLKGAA